MSTTEKELLKRIDTASNESDNGNFEVVSDLKEILILSKQQDFDFSSAKSLRELGRINMLYLGNLETSLAYFKKAISLCEKNSFLEEGAVAHHLLAQNWNQLNNITLFFEHESKAIENLTQAGKVKDTATMLASIGQQMLILKEFKKAEEHLLKAWELSKDTNSEDSNGWSLPMLMGDLYFKSHKNFDKAQEFYQLSFELATKHKIFVGECFALRCFSSVAAAKGDFKKAMDLSDKALELVIEKEQNSFINAINVEKAEYLIKNKDSRSAKKLLESTIKTAKRDTLKLRSHRFLYELYQEEKDFENALYHHKEWLKYKQEETGIELKKHIETTEAKYQNQIKENENEILRLQKVEMQQKALRAQLNPHFFFNALISIQNYILDNEAKTAVKFLQNFSELMRLTLENSEEEFISLENEINFLNNYLSVEQLRFKGKMQFNIDVDDEIETEFIDIPTMLIQPYVENAIKHGVKGLEDGRIKVQFNQIEDDVIQCVVEDNGRGLNLSKGNSGHKSMGTRILNNRFEVLNQRYNKNFESKTIDLKDENGKLKGTRVEIRIPEIELDKKV